MGSLFWRAYMKIRKAHHLNTSRLIRLSKDRGLRVYAQILNVLASENDQDGLTQITFAVCFSTDRNQQKDLSKHRANFNTQNFTSLGQK